MTGTSGTATERTRLAWRRTALSGTAVSLLTARLAIRDGLRPLPLALGALAVVGWGGLLLLSRYRLGSAGASGAPPGWVPVATAACLTWFAVLGAALVVLP
jgi:Domain of unknown function (DUF202)